MEEEKIEKIEEEKIEAPEEVIEELKKEVVEFERRLTREEMEAKERAYKLENWIPKTKLGKLVKDKKIKNIDEVLDNHKILEAEVIQSLIKVKPELLLIGQSKGKFGGGKRRAWRQTQRKTAEGNVPTFACMIAVGNENGYVGLGLGKAKETLPAREKAMRYSELNVIKVNRGCGSFECGCDEKHSVPFKVEGRCGSSKVILYPAPQGTGLVIGDQCKKILKLAGIKDVYSKTFGNTRTTMNIAKACMDALKNTNKINTGKRI